MSLQICEHALENDLPIYLNAGTEGVAQGSGLDQRRPLHVLRGGFSPPFVVLCSYIRCLEVIDGNNVIVVKTNG